MKVLDGGSQSKIESGPNAVVLEYRALLAKVHIAKKELEIRDIDYRMMLVKHFGVTSASCLSNMELEDLVRVMMALGWKPGKPKDSEDPATMDRQVRELHTRIRAAAEALGGDVKQRLRDLANRECNVQEIGWCRDLTKLRRVLGILKRGGAHRSRRAG